MRFWSKGLGKRSHLVIACGSEDVERIDEDHLKLLGYTRPPVEWNYEITMDEEDAVSVLNLGLTPKFGRFLAHPRRMFSALSLLYWVFVFWGKLLVRLTLGNEESNMQKTPNGEGNSND